MFYLQFRAGSVISLDPETHSSRGRESQNVNELT